MCVNTVYKVHVTGTYTDQSPISDSLFKPNTLLLFGLYRFLIYCSSKVSHTAMCKDEVWYNVAESHCAYEQVCSEWERIEKNSICFG